MFSSHPPPSSPPISPVTVDRRSTARRWCRRPAPRTASDGKPLVGDRRGGLAADRAAADAQPVAGDGDDGARFRRRPQRQPPPACASTDPPRVAADPRDREVGQRILVRHPARIEVDRVDLPDVVGSAASGEPGDERGVDAAGQAVRGGEDQVAGRRVAAPRRCRCAGRRRRGTPRPPAGRAAPALRSAGSRLRRSVCGAVGGALRR